MKYLGYALIAGGAVGAYGRYTVYQASQAANPALTSALDKYDPAKLVGITYGSGLLDAGMAFDIALVLLGGYLVMKG
jgi:hypothetical protein